MNKTKRFMYTVAFVSLFLMFALFALAERTGNRAFTALGITTVVICYHFTTRLVMGNIFDGVHSSYFKPDSFRFREMRFEKKLYKIIGVRKWKNLLPVIDEERFALKWNTYETLIGETCRMEAMHWMNAFVSLASVLFSSLFGATPVFVVTAILGTLVELALISVHRYNRPRFRRLVDKEGWETLSTTEISPAAESEAEEIAALYSSLVGEPGCTWNSDYPKLEHVREDIENASLYKLEEMGRIIAAAYFGEFEEIERPECFDKSFKNLGEFARVGVLREFHRKGYAEMLLRHLIDEAKERGFDGIALLVGRENEAAKALYEKLGFENCGEARLYDMVWFCYQLKIEGTQTEEQQGTTSVTDL